MIKNNTQYSLLGKVTLKSCTGHCHYLIHKSDLYKIVARRRLLFKKSFLILPLAIEQTLLIFGRTCYGQMEAKCDFLAYIQNLMY